MTAGDLESRLHRALVQTSLAWQPSEPSAHEIVGQVRRRRARRVRTWIATGCVVTGLTVVAGVYSYVSKTTGNRPTTSATAKSPATPTPGTAPGPGHSNRVVPSPQAPATQACISVTVGSGQSQCVGFFVSPTLGVQEFSPSNAGPAGNTAALPVSLSMKVGQRVTVSVPATTAGAWSAPVAVPASALPATLRQELPGSEPSSAVGAMRVAIKTQPNRARSGSTVFEALKPGDVTLAATAVTGCAKASSNRAATAPSSCVETGTRWAVLVIIASP